MVLDDQYIEGVELVSLELLFCCRCWLVVVVMDLLRRFGLCGGCMAAVFLALLLLRVEPAGRITKALSLSWLVLWGCFY